MTDEQTDGWTDGQTDDGQSDPYVWLCFAGDTKKAVYDKLQHTYTTTQSIIEWKLDTWEKC